MRTVISGYFRLSKVFLFCLILLLGSMFMWDTGSGKTGKGNVSGPDLTGNWERLSATHKGNLILGKLCVTNLGDKRSGHFRIAYYLSDDGTTPGKLIWQTFSKRNLNAQQTRKFPFVYRSTAPIYGKYILAIIDFKNSVAETNETNNKVAGLIAGANYPSADAGPNQTVGVGSTVTLDGSGSSDPDGDSLSYHWSFDSVPAGSNAVLSDLTAVKPTFLVDLAGTYVVRLIVNDGKSDSSPDTVIITTANSPPVAEAGPDQTVPLAKIVNLDGSGSSDVDGDTLSYSWSFSSVPDGSTAVIENPSSVTASFRADRPGDYFVTLTVTDTNDSSDTDDVIISTINSTPVANAGPDQTVAVGRAVTLDGSASADADGDPLSYKWSLTSKPEGSASSLSGTTMVQPTFEADVPGTYVAQLIVNDGTLDSEADTVVVTTLNSPPVSNAGTSQTCTVGSTVTLDGSESNDPDGDPITYQWSFVSRPEGSAATLSGPASVGPTFVADVSGSYVIQLIVYDGSLYSDPSTVVVSTINSAPVAQAGWNQTIVRVGSSITLDGSSSSDVDGDPLSYHWSFVSRPDGSGAALSDANAVRPTFTVDVFGTYVVALVVNDGTVDSDSDSVTITTENSPPVADAGPDQTPYVNDEVTLDGSKSTDVDGNLLTYGWSFLSKPSGSATTLSDDKDVRPTFTVDTYGDYVIQLIVDDGTVKSAPDTVKISTLNSVPQAVAGQAQTVPKRSVVTLDGSGSSDVDLNPLTFKWSFLSRPTNSQAVLSDPTSEKPTFTADIEGDYVVQLIVNDGWVDSAPATVVITTFNSRPVAVAGPDLTVSVGDIVQPDGTGSIDADIDPLTYFWSLTTIPSGSHASLSEPTAASPTFTPDLEGDYVVQLIVNDGSLDSTPDTALVSASVRMVTVPNLSGMSEQAATAALSTAGLTPGTVSKTNSADVPSGQVISQDPVAGASVAQGTSVSFVISLGPAMVSVPDLSGMEEAGAGTAITDAGLVIGLVTKENSSTVPAGHVMSQSPAAGGSVALGSTVNFVVSLGPSMVAVPAVLGLTEEAARESILDSGLTVGNVTTQNSATVPAGQVISQDPPSGTLVEPGSPVELVVSSGNTTVAPNLIGLSQAQAMQAISAANLLAGTITASTSQTVASGFVISQSVAAGTSLPPGSSINLVVSQGPQAGELPPDPATVAPPVDPSAPASLLSSTEFLYTGAVPLQTGVAAGTIQLQRAAVIRGEVMTRDGIALSGVKIAILNHPELGQTLSRTDGMFDLAVNGGGLLVVDYQKEGYLAAQRQVDVPWQDYAMVDDVVLIQADSRVTTVDLSSPTDVQVARGSVATDDNGSRQATLLFPSGITATLAMPDGSTQPVSALNVRATEYTVGEEGPKAMPAQLPPTTGYTYCVELSADEAVSAGAAEVRFSQPLYYYVENYLRAREGSIVPVGYYDRLKGAWIPSENGRVIKILSITGDLADVDTDGDGAADSGFGITASEREMLAALYSAGQSLWRIPINHFSSWDANWGWGPPPDATAPRQPPPIAGDPAEDSPCIEAGSIIECQNQTLGEKADLSGTPFSLRYLSSRVPGREAARILEIPLSGNTVPESLVGIELEIEVAGRKFTHSLSRDHECTHFQQGMSQGSVAAFAAGALPLSVPQAGGSDTLTNQKYTFTWDGKDVYGRKAQGGAPITVRIGYVYCGVYMEPAEIEKTFGYNGKGTPISGSKTLNQIILWQEWTGLIGPWDARDMGFGGWTLDIHHAYDPVTHTLYQGDGQKRDADSVGDVITSFSSVWGHSLAVAPDGTVYQAWDNARIGRIAPDGTVTTFAGGGSSKADGIPATSANLNAVAGVAVGPDGSVYFANLDYMVGVQRIWRIRRVGTDGIITTIAGPGLNSTPYSGDGGPATSANVGQPWQVAVGPDGSVFISSWDGNGRIRRVGTDGIITTVAGGGSSTAVGIPATSATLGQAFGLEIGPDGSVYIGGPNRVYRVGPDGILNVFAGTGAFGFSGDGGPATSATLYYPPQGLALGLDGSLYIADTNNNRIRCVGPNGIITTVAGTGVGQGGAGGDGGPATSATVWRPEDVAVGPDGSLYIAEPYNFRTRRVGAALPGVTLGEITIPSSDGKELFLFSSSGRHLRTLDALTGAVRYQFAYDTGGRLVTVTDVNGNVTTIERDPLGNPTAIVGPYGQKTVLGLDTEGYLSSVANPAGETFHLGYADGGLLSTLSDPKGQVHHFTYDAQGLLVEDENPAGGSKSLERTDAANGYQVALATGMGRITNYGVENLSNGDERHVNTRPGGTQMTLIQKTDGSRKLTSTDGTVIDQLLGPDPRFGMQAPLDKSTSITFPSGLKATISKTRTASLTNANDPLSLTSLSDTVAVNGRNFSTAYSASTRKFTITSPAGRQSTVTIDNTGKVVQKKEADLNPISYTYDSHGRVASVGQGIEPNARKLDFAYNPDGYLDSVVNSLDQVIGFVRDSSGKLSSVTLPDNRTVLFDHDDNGNLTSISPPGRPAHSFAYNALERISAYTPPDIGHGSTTTSYSYNLDGQISHVLRPDGLAIDYGYDAAGRLSTRSDPSGQTTYSYSATTGRLNGISTVEGNTLSYTYDGSLLKSETSGGAVSGSVSYGFDNNFRITSISVNGANPVSYLYDNDSLITGAGNLSLTRGAQNGLITGTTLGGVTSAFSYNGFGEVTSYSASYGGAQIFKQELSRDLLGRVTEKVETISGTSNTYAYGYDPAGRLVTVDKNGARIATYTYDANGNRLSYSGAGGTMTGAYDDQDRLTQYGSATYEYTLNGDLQKKTVGSQVTQYTYDVFGNLKSVTLPSGALIEYTVDGLNRRVGKKVNGAWVKKFLYSGSLEPVAELDGNDAVVSRFVYGSRSIVPDYMVKESVTYRIISDYLGSPRLIVNSSDGTVAQRMDYDEFGSVLLDTNPAFQPFGFAGGLYDPDTKLVRFGKRDYAPEYGRWTARDPSLFNAGGFNLYAYVANNPIDLIDPGGTNGLVVGCIDWLANKLLHKLGEKLLGKALEKALPDLKKSVIAPEPPNPQFSCEGDAYMFCPPGEPPEPEPQYKSLSESDLPAEPGMEEEWHREVMFTPGWTAPQ